MHSGSMPGLGQKDWMSGVCGCRARGREGGADMVTRETIGGGRPHWAMRSNCRGEGAGNGDKGGGTK